MKKRNIIKLDWFLDFSDLFFYSDLLLDNKTVPLNKKTNSLQFRIPRILIYPFALV